MGRGVDLPGRDDPLPVLASYPFTAFKYASPALAMSLSTIRAFVPTWRQ